MDDTFIEDSIVEITAHGKVLAVQSARDNLAATKEDVVRLRAKGSDPYHLAVSLQRAQRRYDDAIKAMRKGWRLV